MNLIKLISALFIVILFTSCTKEIKSDLKVQQESTPEFAITSPSVDVVVICSGSCGGGECNIAKDMVNKYYYCSCESDNCSMIVEILSFENGVQIDSEVLTSSEAQEFLINFVEDKETFQLELMQHISEVHNESSYKIIQTRIGVRSGNTYVKYDYTTELGIDESVLFIYDVMGVKKLKVSCNGTCDVDTQKCTEKYGFGSGDVGCACESDNCYMLLEEIDESTN